jgi:hypothetical protein
MIGTAAQHVKDGTFLLGRYSLPKARSYVCVTEPWIPVDAGFLTRS